MSNPPQQTVAFLGASGGCGLAALRHTLAAGITCVALCRTPSKLAAAFPDGQAPSNLHILQGDAHDADAVARVLRVPGADAPDAPAHLVDLVVCTIGSPFNMTKMTTLDPDVCKKGAAALVAALAALRAAGARTAAGRNPRIVAISTCGISAAGRDYPLATSPMYGFVLKVPHADKRVMEERLAASGEAYTLVRPSLLTDGAHPDRKVRIGVADAISGEGPTMKEGVGYAISREDTGRWMAENLILKPADEYVGKAVLITW